MNRTHLAVLGLLAIEPATGYDLKQLADTSLAHFWKLHYGSMYPALRHLEEEGLVSSRVEERPGAPEARVYEVTRRGRDALQAWLTRPAAPDQVRSELLLKVFLGAHTDRATVVQHLEREAERAAARHEALIAMEAGLAAEAAAHPEMPFWRLALRRGVLVEKARLQWCREALATMEER